MPRRSILARVLTCVFFSFAIAMPPQLAADLDATPAATTAKPLLVMIFDENCKAWCSQVRPVVADLHKSYADNVDFAEIDVTPKLLPDAKKKMKDLGIGFLLEDSIAYVPLVIICESSRKRYKELVGPKSKETYEDCLKKALSKRG